MTVVHVLKGGEVLQSIAGHVVRKEEAGEVYRLLKDFSKREENERYADGNCNR